VAELTGPKAQSVVEDHNSATVEKDGRVVAVHATGRYLDSASPGNLVLKIPAHDKPITVKVSIWSGAKADYDAYEKAAINPIPLDDLTALSKPGPPRWGEPLAVKGVVGKGTEPYVVDTITVPYDNPFKALMFLSGVDFFDNGDAAVCSLHGDVWLVRGIGESLDHVTWQRFATGLYQPLGLKIVNNEVHVLGRDQITILRDTNGDGEADDYVNFNNDARTSTGGHDYSAGLETDRAGNFYHVDPYGLHRVSKDGTNYETLANGFRNAVTLSVSPDDLVTVSPQEGNWTPSSQISLIKPGGYYGYGGPKITPERPLGYDGPMCWIPHGEIDNSTGGQSWVLSDKWGLPRNTLLNLSFGHCSMQTVLYEKVGEVYQAAVHPLPVQFLSGVIRGRFRNQDGQFYAVGIRGWQTSAVKDGCFQRVRYTGAALVAPVGFHVHSNGIRIDFNAPLDREDAADADNFQIEEYNYRYAATYGSKEYKVSDPAVEGRDAVKVLGVKVSADGKSLFLELANVHPVMQMAIKYTLKAAAGGRVHGGLYNTINAIGTSWQP
jgi:hypothetical protein